MAEFVATHANGPNPYWLGRVSGSIGGELQVQWYQRSQANRKQWVKCADYAPSTVKNESILARGLSLNGKKELTGSSLARISESLTKACHLVKMSKYVFEDTADPVQKQLHNELYVEPVVDLCKSVGLQGKVEVHLDHKNMATSRTLWRGGLSELKQLVAETNPDVYECMKRQRLATIELLSLYELIGKQSPYSVIGMFADYFAKWCCPTEETKAAHSPRKDIELAFTQRVFFHQSILGLTVSKRGDPHHSLFDDEKSVPHTIDRILTEINHFAQQNQYVAKLKQLDPHAPKGSLPKPLQNGNMLFFIFEITSYQHLAKTFTPSTTSISSTPAAHTPAAYTPAAAAAAPVSTPPPPRLVALSDSIPTVVTVRDTPDKPPTDSMASAIASEGSDTLPGVDTLRLQEQDLKSAAILVSMTDNPPTAVAQTEYTHATRAAAKPAPADTYKQRSRGRFSGDDPLPTKRRHF